MAATIWRERVRRFIPHLLLIALGFSVVLAISLVLEWASSENKPNDLPIGKLLPKGNVELVIGLERRSLKDTVELYTGSRIETGPNSQATVEFGRSEAVTLGENGRLTLERRDDTRTHLLWIAGPLNTKQLKNASQFVVWREGQKIEFQDAVKYSANQAIEEAKDIPKADSAAVVVIEKSPNAVRSATPAPRTQAKHGGGQGRLTEAEIKSLLDGQIAGARRCYVTYINRQQAKGAKNFKRRGTNTYSLRIGSSGKVTRLTIVKAEFDEPGLASCLSDLLQRVKFRPFDGNAVDITYPITFN